MVAAAVGVVDEDDLARAQQALADEQRADDVIGHHSAGVADDVGVTLISKQWRAP
jgi:hypothetical protein